ncbi:MAG: serine hydrolase [Phycisphaerales bacterium]
MDQRHANGFGSVWTPAAAAVALVAVSPIQAAPPATAEQLDALVQRLDDRREELHIPGMAIAIVQDGEIILAEGLGLADLESERPVTPETIFAIGSSTKTFTSALAGIAVDRGALDWETPVSTYIPWFRLPEADDAADVNLIDLLSHRTGLTRMSLLWFGGGASIEQIYAAVPDAEYYRPFRSTWLYNNVTYAAAGHATAEVAGLTWDELLQRDILGPLGMTDTSTAYAHLADNPNAASGYLWDTESESFDQLPPRELSKIAPAGAINSNVTDMAKWVTVLLNDGALPDGTLLISPESLEMCWTEHAEIPDGRGYGLGWMIDEFEGTTFYEHGGNIDGFASTLAVMPDEGIGLTVLMNVSATPMQGEVIQTVFDALLREPTDESPDDPTDAYERCVGSYYFQALGGDLVVSLDDDGSLSCAIPGQGTTALRAPDEDGFFAFAVNPAARIRFESDETGRIVAAEFKQGPAELMLPRRGDDGELITPGLPFSEEELQLLTGDFHHDQLGETCTILLEDGQLAMDVPSQQTYPLAWDGANERWRFRDYPTITLEFEQEAGEAATSILYTQSGRSSSMPRVRAPDRSELPTLEDIAALRAEHVGSDALDPDRTMRITGRATLVHQGATGSFVAYADGRRRHAQQTDLSPFATMRSFTTEDRAAEISPMSPEPAIYEQGTSEYEIAANSHPWLASAPIGWYAPSAEVRPSEPFEGAENATVIVSDTGVGPAMRIYLDPDTGRTLGVRSAVPFPGVGTIPIVTRYGDWREVDGVWIPHRTEVENPFTGKVVIENDSVAFDVEVPASLFEVEEPAATPG